MTDAVNHPGHYRRDSGMEAIDVIEAWGLNFHAGSALKYIARAGLKDDRRQDLEKARWYLRRLVNWPARPLANSRRPPFVSDVARAWNLSVALSQALLCLRVGAALADAEWLERAVRWLDSELDHKGDLVPCNGSKA